MIKRILVPVDFSDPSLRALDFAVELSRPLAAQVILLHAVEPVYYPVAGDMYGVGFDLGNVYDAIERAARTQLSELAAKLKARGVAVRTLLTLGTAHQVILDSAKKLKADLIVMSTHGRTGLSHVLIGSVAERVVRTAPCPVLTVPGRATRRTSAMRGARRRGGRAAGRSRAATPSVRRRAR
jgi:nucleotide-binding universal stress UspA family protein